MGVWRAVRAGHRAGDGAGRSGQAGPPGWHRCAPLRSRCRRVYYIYDVPGGSERGSHAHKHLHEFIIAMSGSFDVVPSSRCICTGSRPMPMPVTAAATFPLPSNCTARS
ncbi:MAG: WxcM-like domain-containing protein [Rhodoferax sp.]|nr:WxcM-like domain-containing protein [Rhodoferax sp.]